MSMTRDRALFQVRLRIGNPSLDDLPNRDLEPFFESALEWLAAELDYRTVTLAAGLSLAESTYAYPLPADFLQLIWVEWNGTKLSPSSVAAWVRDNRDWRGAEDGNPAEFAVEGRTLLLYPPPSDDAITTDPALALSYLGGSEGLAAEGVPDLPDTTLWLAIFKTACEWLGANPDEKGLNTGRAMACEKELALRLPEAKRRMEAIRDRQGEMTIFTRRTGGAR